MNSVIGYAMKQKMVPLGGEGTPIAPPTYGEGKFAFSENGSVVVNSVAAESHEISMNMKRVLDDVCSEGAPGIYVNPPADGVIEKKAESAKGSMSGTILEDNPDAIAAELKYAVDMAMNEGGGLSSWTTSHRQADSVIRYSLDPDTGKQVWSGGSIGDLVRNSGNGDDMARNFPNSALLGLWLSSRSPRPVRIARSISSQVVGYGAQEIVTGASKIDPFGGIPAANNGLVGGNVEVSHNDKGKGNKPSEVGFGSIPGTVKTTHFVCDEIVRNAIFSMRALECSTTLSAEVEGVIKSLGIVSLAMSDGGFYRSGTDLIPVDTVMTEIYSDGSRVDVNIDDEVSTHMDIVREGAHIFASPLHVELSDPILSLILSKISVLAHGK